MKKFLTILSMCVVAFFITVGVSFAQDTVPPLTLPTDDETVPTATATASEEIIDAEPTLVVSTITASATATVYEDVAETGSEIYVLLAVSFLAGFGIYSLIKYRNIKKYSI